MLRMFVVVGAVVLSGAVSASAQQYSVTDLGTLGTGSSEARGINSFGHVVGTSNDHAILWRDGNVIDLGQLPSYFPCYANGINDNDVVVGTCNGANFTSRAFVWTDDTGMVDLGTPDGSDAWQLVGAGKITNDGNILGYAVGTSAFQGRGFIYAYPDGGFTSIFDEGTGPAAMNSQGQLAGCCVWTDQVGHAALWNSDGILDLGALADACCGMGGTWSTASDINEDGVAVGYSRTGDPNQWLAVAYTSGGIVNLGTLGGFRSAAVAINGGLIVGYSEWSSDTSWHAFIYDLYGGGTSPADLNDLIDPASGWILRDATGINASGQIVGFGQLNGAGSHAFLLTPVSTDPPQ